VNNFDYTAVDTLDEWIYYIKNSNLPQGFWAKGLNGVAAQLIKETMSKQEQQDYAMFLDKLTVTQESLEATLMDAMEKGIITGIPQGEYLKARAAASKMIAKGYNDEEIADITGLTLEQIAVIRKEIN